MQLSITSQIWSSTDCRKTTSFSSSTIPSSPAQANKSMRAELAEGAFVMTRASSLLYFLHFGSAERGGEDGESALGRARDSLRAAAPISTSSLHSLLWDKEITAVPRENPSPSWSYGPLLVAHMRKRELASKSLSGPHTGQPDKDYASLLNEGNNALKPLTSIVVLNRITRRLQCDYADGQFEPCGHIWFQSPLMFGNVQNVISCKAKY